MKTYTIRTFIRPVLPTDVFEEDNLVEILDQKQFFYKLSDGSFYGPSRVQSCKSKNDLQTMRKDEREKQQPILDNYQEKELAVFYEICNLYNNGALFIADKIPYLESIEIHVKVKQVEEVDIFHGKSLIVNTAYFQKKQVGLDGPFYIKNEHNKETFRPLIATSNMFVYDKPGVVKVIKLMA